MNLEIKKTHPGWTARRQGERETARGPTPWKALENLLAPQPAAGAPPQDRLLAFLAGAGGPVTRREVLRGIRGMSAKDLDAALLALGPRVRVLTQCVGPGRCPTYITLAGLT